MLGGQPDWLCKACFPPRDTPPPALPSGWGRQLSPEVSRASGVLRHLRMMGVARPGCRDGVLWSRPGLKEAKTHSKRENCLLSDNHSPLGSLC